MNIYSVLKQDDTGKRKLHDIIKRITTGMDYDRTKLIPIYNAYNAVRLAEGCSAIKLREAIRSRLMQENLIPPVAGVSLDEP